MHHPRSALYLAVRPPLVVVGVQALRVRRRESRYARESRSASLRIAAVLRQRPSSTVSGAAENWQIDNWRLPAFFWVDLRRTVLSNARITLSPSWYDV